MLTNLDAISRLPLQRGQEVVFIPTVWSPADPEDLQESSDTNFRFSGFPQHATIGEGGEILGRTDLPPHAPWVADRALWEAVRDYGASNYANEAEWGGWELTKMSELWQSYANPETRKSMTAEDIIFAAETASSILSKGERSAFLSVFHRLPHAPENIQEQVNFYFFLRGMSRGLGIQQCLPAGQTTVQAVPDKILNALAANHLAHRR